MDILTDGRTEPIRAATERFALITGMGKVLAVTEIEGVTKHGDRIALEGQPLAAGHSLYDAYIGRPDPLANQSQNSITYGSLPEEGPFRIRPCGCGCGGGKPNATSRPATSWKLSRRASASTSAGQLVALIQWIDKTHLHPAS